MRRWRANHPEEEARIYANRKAADIVEVPRSEYAEESQGACGFCGKRNSIARVSRLRVSDEAGSGYEEIEVPYCGIC